MMGTLSYTPSPRLQLPTKGPAAVSVASSQPRLLPLFPFNFFRQNLRGRQQEPGLATAQQTTGPTLPGLSLKQHQDWVRLIILLIRGEELDS